MDFDFQTIIDWFNDNKDWMLIPSIICIVVVILGLVLMILTGKDLNTALKAIFIVLLVCSPILGYYLGDFIDPYLSPLFSKISSKP